MRVVFVCVPTPMNSDGSCDISVAENVINEFSDVRLIVINKSTVVPGTTDF